MNKIEMLRKNWLIAFAFLIGMVCHIGTALLRLKSFFPFPQALDFSSYYVGAWSLRKNLSLTPFSNELINFLMENHFLPTLPPVHNSPPIWAWLLQPFTFFSYPIAATLWLGLLLILTIVCHILIMETANIRQKRVRLILFPLTLTFGPLFLTLTLGQNSHFLLLACLCLGFYVSDKTSSKLTAWWMWWIASIAKVYPLVWISSLILLKKWRAFIFFGVATLFISLASIALNYEQNRVYWLVFLPNQTQKFANSIDIDDQSLIGWINTVTQTGEIDVPSIDVDSRQRIQWKALIDLPPNYAKLVAYVFCALIGVVIIISGVKFGQTLPEAVVYSIVLYTLILIPHIARYNHILMLPSIALMFREKKTFYMNIGALAYLLTGFSRLNHFWVLYTTWPIPQLMVGSGIGAVLLLLVGIQVRLAKGK